jgi:hypothetical protein
MKVQNIERLKQVQRYGVSLRRLSKFLFALAAVSGVATILLLAFGERGRTSLLFGGIEYPADTVPIQAVAIAMVSVVLGVALLLKLFFHMIRLFDLYSLGVIFSVENVHHLHQIGVTVFFFLILWFLQILAQLTLPAGVSELNLGRLFSILVLGTVIVFFSWVMDVGRELREDQDLVV